MRFIFCSCNDLFLGGGDGGREWKCESKLRKWHFDRKELAVDCTSFNVYRLLFFPAGDPLVRVTSASRFMKMTSILFSLLVLFLLNFCFCLLHFVGDWCCFSQFPQREAGDV